MGFCLQGSSRKEKDGTKPKAFKVSCLVWQRENRHDYWLWDSSNTYSKYTSFHPRLEGNPASELIGVLKLLFNILECISESLLMHELEMPLKSMCLLDVICPVILLCMLHSHKLFMAFSATHLATCHQESTVSHASAV